MRLTLKALLAKFRGSSRIAVSFWLACLTLSSLSVFAFDSTRSPDLVFCPLQKLWVPRHLPDAQQKISLPDICAGTPEKTAFLLRLALKLSHDVTISKKAEDLFFSYRSKGDNAFADLPSMPDSPPQVLPVANEPGGSVAHDDFTIIRAEHISFHELSRPPTQPASASFSAPRLADLETISHAIKPRAPPVSLL